MKDSQWTALGVLLLLVPAFGLVAWFVVFHFFVMAPHSRDPDYRAAYWVESELYYGSECARLMSELKAAGVVEPGLIACTRNPCFGFVNTKNGTFLHLRKYFSLRIMWLPWGEKVIVDTNNGYVFWAKDGKVTDFVKLDRRFRAQLLESPAASTNGPGATPTASPSPPGARREPRTVGEATRHTPADLTPTERKR